jgi:membrane associated rhomboid family serine protease
MLPYSCDALLYHWPIVTVTLIAINVTTFVAALNERINVANGWLLEYGTGLHPAQWLLSTFMHANFEHLLGNMFFLWAFGLITEGKLGWWKFLLVYLGIAIGQSGIEQAVMPMLAPDVPFTLGASAAIYGLMAMACVWAPVNELSVFMLLGFRPITFEMNVGVFAAIYVGLDTLYCLLFGVGAIGSIAHLMGGAMGLALGVALLKMGVAECNDYDLLSVLSGTYGSDKQKQREAEAVSPERIAVRMEEQAVEARRRFDAYLAIDQPQQALAVRRRMVDMKRPLELERKDLMRLIVGLHKQEAWVESAPVMAELIERFPEGSEGVRLKLAQICLVKLDKPARTIELLSALDASRLPADQVKLCQKMRAVAEQKVSEGELEVDDGAW